VKQKLHTKMSVKEWKETKEYRKEGDFQEEPAQKSNSMELRACGGWKVKEKKTGDKLGYLHRF